MMRPMNRNVLIEPKKKEDVTASGLILSESNDAVTSGIVRSIGREVTDLAVGDNVVFKEYAPEKVVIDEVEYFILDINDILGVYEE